jgi:hypothetical protein
MLVEVFQPRTLNPEPLNLGYIKPHTVNTYAEDPGLQIGMKPRLSCRRRVENRFRRSGRPEEKPDRKRQYD